MIFIYKYIYRYIYILIYTHKTRMVLYSHHSKLFMMSQWISSYIQVPPFSWIIFPSKPPVRLSSGISQPATGRLGCRCRLGHDEAKHTRRSLLLQQFANWKPWPVEVQWFTHEKWWFSIAYVSLLESSGLLRLSILLYWWLEHTGIHNIHRPYQVILLNIFDIHVLVYMCKEYNMLGQHQFTLII